MRVTLPRGQLPPIIDHTKDTGSLDDALLKSKLPNKLNASSAYSDIANLAARAEALKHENDRLNQELQELLGSGTSQGFILERLISNLEARLNSRDKELATIVQKYPKTKTANPTFLDVEIHRDRTNFDAVASSLLVSNGQRSFFKSNDLYVQNIELEQLIQTQEEELRSLQSRLNLYISAQHRELPKLTLDSLSRNASPMKLIDATVSRATEQNLKKKLLQRQLHELVEERQKLTNKRKRRTFSMRVLKKQIESALIIQRIVRGFLARCRMKKYNEAATNIQRVWRGAYVRRDLKVGRKRSPNTPTRGTRVQINLEEFSNSFYEEKDEEFLDPVPDDM